MLSYSSMHLLFSIWLYLKQKRKSYQRLQAGWSHQIFVQIMVGMLRNGLRIAWGSLRIPLRCVLCECDFMQIESHCMLHCMLGLINFQVLHKGRVLYPPPPSRNLKEAEIERQVSDQIIALSSGAKSTSLSSFPKQQLLVLGTRPSEHLKEPLPPSEIGANKIFWIWRILPVAVVLIGVYLSRRYN